MNIREIMAKAIPAVEFMYDRTAEIHRHGPYKKPNGATGTGWFLVAEGVPCRISSLSLNNTKQGEVNEIEYDTKLFLSSDYQVLAGDKVFVSDQDGANRLEFQSAREPFVYVSHQEVLLLRKGHA